MLETLKNIQTKCYNELVGRGVKFKNGMPKLNLKRVGKGNSKLDKSILIFDLLAGKTVCGKTCKKCYAIKAQIQYSHTKLFRSINTELAFNHIGILKELICNQIKRSKTTKTIRIHSSGDFFSQAYIDMWKEIMQEFPDLKFYTYTKQFGTKLDFNEITKMPIFNLIDSMVKIDGKLEMNYGNETHVEKLVELGYKVCPAVKSNWKGICGADCTLCMTTDKICFHIH